MNLLIDEELLIPYREKPVSFGLTFLPLLKQLLSLLQFIYIDCHFLKKYMESFMNLSVIFAWGPC